MLTNKTILITGGTGSFGNTFVPMTLDMHFSRSSSVRAIYLWENRKKLFFIL